MKDVIKKRTNKQASSTTVTEQSDIAKLCISKSYNFKV